MPVVRLLASAAVLLGVVSGIAGHHAWSGPTLLSLGFDRGVTVGDLAVVALASAATALLWAIRR